LLLKHLASLFGHFTTGDITDKIWPIVYYQRQFPAICEFHDIQGSCVEKRANLKNEEACKIRDPAGFLYGQSDRIRTCAPSPPSFSKLNSINAEFRDFRKMGEFCRNKRNALRLANSTQLV